MPGFPATDLITAVGVAFTGVGQAAKQLQKSYRPPALHAPEAFFVCPGIENRADTARHNMEHSARSAFW